MKFIKSDLAKKLIIILIALMIFNFAVPKQVKAWNFAGILMKPITALILSFMVSIDVQIGLFLQVVDIATTGVGTIVQEITDAAEAGSITKDMALSGTSKLLNEILIGPDTIFSGNLDLLDANIFEATAPRTSGTLEDNMAGSNMSGTIKQGIATTYVILRNICAIIMLGALIFTGIRVLISSNNPSKRAAWLQLVYDWLIGMVLLIFSHVIMYGVFYISDGITEALATSLMGFGGLNFTLIKTCLTSFDSAEQVITLVMLGYLIYLTIVFVIAYFKRLMWICVLIVIAPIVAIMYAFGSQTKQIYSKWIREYITTVLVQPFHMIVYYTLVSVPLNMVSGGRGSLSSQFTIIYALAAISFIRPAEKYIRGLFGMNQGIAEMASFDSGKQTMDAVVDAGKKIALMIGQAVAAVATAGASTAVTAATTATTATAATAETTAIASGAEAGITPEVFTSGAGVDPNLPVTDAPMIDDVPPREDIYGDITEDPFHDDYWAGDQFYDNNLQNPPIESPKMDENALQEHLDNLGLEGDERLEMENDLREAGHGDQKTEDSDVPPREDIYGDITDDPFHDDYWAGDQFYDNNLQNPPIESESLKMDENALQEHLDNLGLEGDERLEMENDLREAGHGDQNISVDNIDEEVPEIKTKEPIEENETMTDEYLQDIANKQDDKDNGINTDNVRITADNIIISGNVNASDEIRISGDIKVDEDSEDENGGDKDSTESAAEDLEKEKDNLTDEEREKQERIQNAKNTKYETIKEGEDVDQREKDDFLKRRLKDLNAATDFALGRNTPFETMDKISPDSLLKTAPEKFKNSKFMENLREGKHGDKVKGLEEKYETGKAIARKFDEMGGFKELHAGFNNVKDTFFVGGAPGDWKNTNQRMEVAFKANIDEFKANIVNNEDIQNDIIMKEGYIEELKKKHPDYTDARIEDMAKDKAKEKLKSLTDTYVPLGIRDPMLMLDLSKDQKKYGYTPEEAIRQKVQYDKFNISQENIQYVNEHFEAPIPVKSVADGIEPARQYYNNGYTNIGDLSRVHELTDLLRVTPELGMKLDRALTKKGSKIDLKLDDRKDLSQGQKDQIKTFIDERYVKRESNDKKMVE